ncbi:MAG: hypothetical protein ACYDAR_07610 [Thermomicrobiales bacterium]
MDMKTLRKRCAARIPDLPIPFPFDVQIFTSSLAERRGRPIALQPMSLHGVISGAWVAMPSVDVVVYDQYTTPLHQQHIILHELSHIICEHEGIDSSEKGLQSLLFAHIPVARLRTLQDDQYSDGEEQEAEVLASLILERVSNAQTDSSISDPYIAGTLQVLDDLEGMTS